MCLHFFSNFQNSNNKRYPILKRKCCILLNGKFGEITIPLTCQKGICLQAHINGPA